MKILLFDPKRERPNMYDVPVNGKWERTVSIRMGVSWPKPGIPGYFVLVAQLHPGPAGSDYNFHGDPKAGARVRLLPFVEGHSLLLNELFEQICEACIKWRIDYIYHGDEP